MLRDRGFPDCDSAVQSRGGPEGRVGSMSAGQVVGRQLSPVVYKRGRAARPQ